MSIGKSPGVKKCGLAPCTTEMRRAADVLAELIRDELKCCGTYDWTELNGALAAYEESKRPATK